MKQFRIDICQFNQRDRRDEVEHLLKRINQSVAAYGKKCADEEVKVHPRIDCIPSTCLRESDSRISQYLRKQDIAVKPYGRFLRIGILLPATNAALLAALRKGNL